MVLFTNLCIVRRLTGTDVYGKETHGLRRGEKVSIVKLSTSRQHTTIRADASATRGFAEEVVGKSVVLFNKESLINISDIIELAGITLRVQSKRLRFDVHGKPDHLEIGALIE